MSQSDSPVLCPDCYDASLDVIPMSRTDFLNLVARLKAGGKGIRIVKDDTLDKYQMKVAPERVYLNTFNYQELLKHLSGGQDGN